MVVKGNYEYKKAIIIDSDRMRQLNSILMLYCEKIEYTACLQNGRTETCKNIEDLLSAENYDDNRIVKIEIWAHNYQNDNSISLSIGINDWESFFFAYATICRSRYSLCDRESAYDYVQAINKLMNKCKASYWWISKINYNTVFAVPSMLITVYNLMSGKLNNSSISVQAFIIALAIAVLLIVVLKYIDKKLHMTLLSPVNFVWGEEERRHSKMNTIRSNLLWTVTIGMIIGIIAGVVSGRLISILASLF